MARRRPQRWLAGKKVKRNHQLSPDYPQRTLLQQEVLSILSAHPVLQRYARPERFSQPLFNRYQQGEHYGWHSDDALLPQQPQAQDSIVAGQDLAPSASGGTLLSHLSYTLFLSEPQSYDGGALCLRSHAGESEIKLDAGAMLVYPAHAIHCVQPVTRGVRYACVGWIQSRVADAELRGLLFDLNLARSHAQQFSTPGMAAPALASAADELQLQLAQIEGALLRRFAR